MQGPSFPSIEPGGRRPRFIVIKSAVAAMQMTALKGVAVFAYRLATLSAAERAAGFAFPLDRLRQQFPRQPCIIGKRS